MKYLKKFENHTEYEAYIASEGKVLPNVSICDDTKDVHYNPFVETRVVAKFNVTDTSSPTKIANNTSNFSEIEIDGVKQSSVTTGYTFDTVGEHTVKYTLKNATSISGSAFWNCRSLTSIDIPNSVTSIGDRAFEGCSSLTSIDIPSGVTSISNQAFSGCSSLTSIVIPDSVTSIGQSAFYECYGLKSATIGSGVTSIGDSAFGYCSSLTSIVIPDSVTSIGYYTFRNCSGLTSCTIGSGVTTIGGTFLGCTSLRRMNSDVDGVFNIPSGVTTIGGSAFWNCRSLTSIDIPDGVTTIGYSAFTYCSSLTSIDIPNSVTSIGDRAFKDCSGLTSITSYAVTAPTIQSDTFQYVKTGGTLTVPTGSTGYDVWMGTGNYYLGKYNWTKVER